MNYNFNKKWIIYGAIGLVVLLAILGFAGVLPGPESMTGEPTGSMN